MNGRTLMNVRETAAYLGVCEETVYRMAREGTIPAFKLAGWKFRKDLIDQWIESNSRPAVNQELSR